MVGGGGELFALENKKLSLSLFLLDYRKRTHERVARTDRVAHAQKEVKFAFSRVNFFIFATKRKTSVFEARCTSAQQKNTLCNTRV